MLRFNGGGKFNLPVGNVDFNKNVINALNGYFNFVDMYHAIRGDLNIYNKLDNITQVKNWDDVYLNYYHHDNWHVEVAKIGRAHV
jgi:DNA adenine methylase